MIHVKKKDKVVVLAGKDRGKRGEVVEVDTRAGRVLVAKVNMVKRHTKRTMQEPAAIREKEMPLPLCRVMWICSKCDRPSRAKFGALSDGTKTRVCRHCGEMVV